MSTQTSPTKPQIVFVVRFSDSVPLMCQRYTEAFAIGQQVKGICQVKHSQNPIE